MKANCKVLKVSLVLSISLFIIILSLLYFVLNYDCKLLNIIFNIVVGLFGSSFVALFMAIPAYTVSKRQLLEKFFQEAKRLIESIAMINYLFNEFNDDLVVSYVNEFEKKKEYEEYNKISDEKINDEYDEDRNKLIKEYLKKHKNLLDAEHEDTVNDYAGKCVDSSIDKIRKNAKRIYNNYIDISKESTINLNFMLGDLHFLTGKKPYNKIYNNIYLPLFNMLNDIKMDSCHFELLSKKEIKESTALLILFKLQNKIFSVDVKETKNYKNYIIYNKFYNQMIMSLEEFRADMYGIKQEKIILTPVETRTYSKNFR